MKRIRGFCLGFLIVILLFPYGVWAATYYIDATMGNDNNDGLSPSTAWKTIAKLNRSSFDPGDQILFKRGELWREQLTVPSSGLPGNPIIFGAYGSGNNPIISAANVYNNSDWSFDSGNVWYIDSTITGVVVVIEGRRFEQVSEKDDLTTNKYWVDADKDKIYVYLTDDPDNHKTELSARNSCIYVNAKQYITIDGIKCQYASYAGIRLHGSQAKGYCIIRNCETYHNRIFGIVCQVGHGNNTVENCISHYNGVNLYTMNSNNNVFRDNVSHHAIYYTTSPYTDGTGFGNQESNNTIFEGNEVYDNAQNGIEAWYGANLSFDRNFSYNNAHHGIVLDYVSGDTNVRYNICVNNGKGEVQLHSYGILLWLHNSGNIYLYNNTIYNDDEHAHGFLWSSGNITAKNNLVYVSRGDKYCVVYIENITNFVTDHNDFYNSAGENIILYNKAYSLATWQARGEDWDDNSISQAPFFVDVHNNNFHLHENSPCIDAGSDVGLAQDHDGNPIQGIAPDIGAYEYIDNDDSRPAPPKGLRIL